MGLYCYYIISIQGILIRVLHLRTPQSRRGRSPSRRKEGYVGRYPCRESLGKCSKSMRRRRRRPCLPHEVARSCTLSQHSRHSADLVHDMYIIPPVCNVITAKAYNKYNIITHGGELSQGGTETVPGGLHRVTGEG